MPEKEQKQPVKEGEAPNPGKMIVGLTFILLIIAGLAGWFRAPVQELDFFGNKFTLNQLGVGVIVWLAFALFVFAEDVKTLFKESVRLYPPTDAMNKKNIYRMMREHEEIYGFPIVMRTPDGKFGDVYADPPHGRQGVEPHGLEYSFYQWSPVTRKYSDRVVKGFRIATQKVNTTFANNNAIETKTRHRTGMPKQVILPAELAFNKNIYGKQTEREFKSIAHLPKEKQEEAIEVLKSEEEFYENE